MLRHPFVFPQALFLALFAGASVSTMAMPETSTNAMSLTVEEARISKLRERHPEVADRYSDIVNQAKSSFDHAGDYEAMRLLTHHTGKDFGKPPSAPLQSKQFSTIGVFIGQGCHLPLTCEQANLPCP